MIFFKNNSLFIVLSICFSLTFSLQSYAKKNTHCIDFTKADENNWEYIIKDKTLAPSEVFTLNNGLLTITGKSVGYLRTKKSYKNYVLKLDWRWTAGPGNSGVLVHIQKMDSIWPVCYQVQQKVNAAGDLICMNGLWAKECTDTIKSTVLKMKTSNEKPLGEWNSMEIICKKKTIKVFVNGLLQNSITGIDVNKGYIGFQNEGKPIQFKNLSIK